MNHSMTGRTLDRTTIKDGMIMMITGGSEIEIGPLEDLTLMHGETITDPNGIDINIELLVDSLALTETQSSNIKTKSPVRGKDTDMLSPRMNTFHGIVLSYVKGNIKKKVD